MEREIEFRIKDNEGKWHCGYPVFYDDGSFHFFDCDLLNRENPMYPIELCYIVGILDNTLGQYVGLKDKHGNNIYEGDIIKNNYGSIYVVKYFDDWSSFSLKLVFLKSEGKLSRANGRQHLYKNDCHLLEIIGNIYDNKGLLD